MEKVPETSLKMQASVMTKENMALARIGKGYKGSRCGWMRTLAIRPIAG